MSENLSPKKHVPPNRSNKSNLTLSQKAQKKYPQWTDSIKYELKLHFGLPENATVAEIKEAILNNPYLTESWEKGTRPEPDKISAELKESKHIKSKFVQFKELLQDPQYLNCELFDLCHAVGIDEATGLQWKNKIAKKISLLDKSKLRKQSIEESLEILLMEGIKKIRQSLNNPEEIKRAREIIAMISAIQNTYKNNITTNLAQINNEPTETNMPEIKISFNDSDDVDDSFKNMK